MIIFVTKKNKFSETIKKSNFARRLKYCSLETSLNEPYCTFARMMRVVEPVMLQKPMFFNIFRTCPNFSKNKKSSARSFSGHRFFPDLSLGMHEVIIPIFIYDKSREDAREIKRDIIIFVTKIYK